MSTTGRLLVVDVGTSSVRAAIVRADGTTLASSERELLPDSPADGLVEFDATLMARTCLDLARAALDDAGPVDAVGVSNQRGSTIVWDRATGMPTGPALGWQDLRTVGACLALRADDVRVGPNQSATKVQWLLDQLDDRGRADTLCFGTVDTWVAWALSDGRLHVIDATNAAVTGMLNRDASGWDARVLDVLGVPAAMMPAIVDSAGEIGNATALPGAPPITALVGDQQASLVGQGCVRRGDAKITFGTGGMLDVVLDDAPPRNAQRGEHGTFPIIAWRHLGRTTWGLEAIMLAAGTNVQWLRDDLGIIADASEVEALARSVPDSGDVVFVPAFSGLFAPHWRSDARGVIAGLTRFATRAHIARAALEATAYQVHDLGDAMVADLGEALPAELRVDGGMTRNQLLMQFQADILGRPVVAPPIAETSALGAAYAAGVAVGFWSGLDELRSMDRAAQRWEPAMDEATRAAGIARWHKGVERSLGWVDAAD
jgi:glycerol kinase